VRKQTLDTATLFGLGDRGVIQVGKKADINVIDMAALNLDVPRMVYDLPAVTRRHGADTGARPGALIRGVR
jgi:N-acyl-D-amino-acid deacylase